MLLLFYSLYYIISDILSENLCTNLCTVKNNFSNDHNELFKPNINIDFALTITENYPITHVNKAKQSRII